MEQTKPPLKMEIRQTPSQTVGPYFAYGLTPEQYLYPFESLATPEIVGPDVDGELITIRGQIFDGNHEVISDAMLEFWHADNTGRYNTAIQDTKVPGFRGFGRVGTGTFLNNEYIIRTIKPGAIGNQAPFIHVTLFMRGMLNHMFTRIYFEDEAGKNETDPWMGLVDSHRRNTLIARKEKGQGNIEYRFDIHVQGDNETVFFDF